jgi:hypothetical protein
MPARWVAALAAGTLLLAGAACSDHPDPRSSSSTSAAGSASTTTDTARFRSSITGVTASELSSSWRPGCPQPVEQLRAIDASFWGFDGRVHEGRIVVDATEADAIVQVLRDLFAARYEIDKMEPIDRYGGSDDASVDANNTSGFNCRKATGGTGWSEHAYGRAIDLNPLQNPYVVGDVVLPAQSAALVDRTRTDQGMIHDGDAAVVAFAKIGWTWGGNWRSSKDYQHFSADGR